MYFYKKRILVGIGGLNPSGVTVAEEMMLTVFLKDE